MSAAKPTLRQWMQQALRHAMIALVLAMAASPATAKETAKDRYDFDIACVAISAAATSLPTQFAKQRADAATMHQLYSKRLTASAAALHIPEARARAEAESDREGFVDALHPADPRAIAPARAELVKNLERCEAVPMFEVLDRLTR